MKVSQPQLQNVNLEATKNIGTDRGKLNGMEVKKGSSIISMLKNLVAKLSSFLSKIGLSSRKAEVSQPRDISRQQEVHQRGKFVAGDPNTVLGDNPVAYREELMLKKDEHILNALKLFGDMPDYSSLGEKDPKPDAPKSPLRQNNFGNDLALDEGLKVIMGKLKVGDKVPQKGGEERKIQEPFAIIANLPKLLWRSDPVFSGPELTVLVDLPSIPTCIGNKTFKNRMGEEVVPDNSKEEQQQAALSLHESIQNLPEQTKSELKARVNFLAIGAQLSLQKYGPSDSASADKSSAEQLRVWQKAVSVGGANYLGLGALQPQALLGGVDNKEATGRINDLVVALVMHFDVVFGEQPSIPKVEQPNVQRPPTRNELPPIVQNALAGKLTGESGELDNLLDTLLTIDPQEVEITKNN